MSEEKPNSMQQLFDLCKKRRLYVGVSMEPQRKADECDKELVPELKILIANGKPITDSVILYDKVTISLETSCKFLIGEINDMKDADG